MDNKSKDQEQDWELETPLYNFYNLNPVDMSYNFSYDTVQDYSSQLVRAECVRCPWLQAET